MKKDKLKSQAGVTFIELMIAIGIIGIISSVFILIIHPDDFGEIKRVTDQVAADFRYTRNLAVSRATYDFGGSTGEIYPPGGYGFQYEDRHDEPVKYFIFANLGIDGTADADNWDHDYDTDKDFIIKEVILDNPIIEMTSSPSESWTRYFTFLTEDEIDSNWGTAGGDNYILKIENPGPGYPDQGYRGMITIGEKTEDGHIWSRIGAYYTSFTPPDDSGGGGGCGKICPQLQIP
ncbi:prepilin-type N-terminal cleavage/methylation domain-containing protein [Candidatus Parcubacteria bacterium]|jgi:prepilin-type N-terminal cleavage/methylation domain-containing protein|nr:prepilin-type N-terminal cleavage/methylation domain-containing protein [Candidatus Parcubacteria bacterium]